MQMAESADPELLIESIRVRPCLWDVFSMEYNDRRKIKTSWEEVTRIFYPDFDNFSEQERNSLILGLQRKWRNMRDSYVKDLRVWTGKGPCTSRFGKRRKYIFFDRLSFLKPSVEAKMTKMPSVTIKKERPDSDNSQSDEEAYLSSSVTSDLNNRIDPKTLISVVEATPCLWDHTCTDYRDRAMTKESWLNVCRSLFPLYDDLQEADRINILGTVQRMWRNFRDSFVKDWKASLTPSLRPLRRKKYIFYDKLKFLLKSLEWKMKANPALIEENSDELSYPEYEDSWFDGPGIFGDEEQPMEEMEKKYNPLEGPEEPSRDHRFADEEANQLSHEEQPIYPICSISNSPQALEPRQPDEQEQPKAKLRKLLEPSGSSPSTSSPTAPELIPQGHHGREGVRPAQTTFGAQCQLAPADPLNGHQPTKPLNESLSQEVLAQLLSDDDLAFFISLLPSVRKLGEDDKLEFRVEVLRLIQRMKARPPL